MFLFITLYLLIYGAMHLYLYLKLRSAFALDARTHILVVFFLLLMVLAPLLVHFLERLGIILAARLFAYVGYSWLAVLFLFLSISLLLDFYHVALALPRIIGADLSRLTPTAHYRFLIPFALALVISIYGFFEARNVRIERLTVESAKIPAQIGEIEIAQISDMHLGLIVGNNRLKHIVEILKRENPDIVVSTGDLVDASVCYNEGIADVLGDLNPIYGKFAVTGNHEFYADLNQALRCHGEAGFKVLRGEAEEIGGVLNVVGVDDPEAARFGWRKMRDEEELLSSVSNGQFTLFLKHRPNVKENTLGLFDLMLSGHTHKGQIFPFNLITRQFFTVNSGFAQLHNHSNIYVSRGTGTWGPPVRFLAPPELTMITIITPEK